MQVVMALLRNWHGQKNQRMITDELALAVFTTDEDWRESVKNILAESEPIIGIFYIISFWYWKD